MFNDAYYNHQSFAKVCTAKLLIFTHRSFDKMVKKYNLIESKIH